MHRCSEKIFEESEKGAISLDKGGTTQTDGRGESFRSSSCQIGANWVFIIERDSRGVDEADGIRTERGKFTVMPEIATSGGRSCSPRIVGQELLLDSRYKVVELVVIMVASTDIGIIRFPAP